MQTNTYINMNAYTYTIHSHMYLHMLTHLFTYIYISIHTTQTYIYNTHIPSPTLNIHI